MARHNQFAGKSPAQRTRRAASAQARRLSLENRGVDVLQLASELGVGLRRACAEAERRLGLRWCDGRSFGLAQGHYRAKAAGREHIERDHNVCRECGVPITARHVVCEQCAAR